MKKVIWIVILILVWTGITYSAPLGFIQANGIVQLEIFFAGIYFMLLLFLVVITYQAIKELK